MARRSNLLLFRRLAGCAGPRLLSSFRAARCLRHRPLAKLVARRGDRALLFGLAVGADTLLHAIRRAGRRRQGCPLAKAMHMLCDAFLGNHHAAVLTDLLPQTFLLGRRLTRNFPLVNMLTGRRDHFLLQPLAAGLTGPHAIPRHRAGGLCCDDPVSVGQMSVIRSLTRLLRPAVHNDIVTRLNILIDFFRHVIRQVDTSVRTVGIALRTAKQRSPGRIMQTNSTVERHPVVNRRRVARSSKNGLFRLIGKRVYTGRRHHALLDIAGHARRRSLHLFADIKIYILVGKVNFHIRICIRCIRIGNPRLGYFRFRFGFRFRLRSRFGLRFRLGFGLRFRFRLNLRNMKGSYVAVTVEKHLQRHVLKVIAAIAAGRHLDRPHRRLINHKLGLACRAGKIPERVHIPESAGSADQLGDLLIRKLSRKDIRFMSVHDADIRIGILRCRDQRAKICHIGQRRIGKRHILRVPGAVHGRPHAHHVAILHRVFLHACHRTRYAGDAGAAHDRRGARRLNHLIQSSHAGHGVGRFAIFIHIFVLDRGDHVIDRSDKGALRVPGFLHTLQKKFRIDFGKNRYCHLFVRPVASPVKRRHRQNSRARFLKSIVDTTRRIDRLCLSI